MAQKAQPQSSVPPPRKLTRAEIDLKVAEFSDCLYDILVKDGVLCKALPFDVALLQQKDSGVIIGIDVIVPGRKVYTLAFKAMTIGTPDIKAAVIQLLTKAQSNGYQQFNHRLRFNPEDWTETLQRMAPSPNDPPEAQKMLKDMQTHITSLMGHNGPEALASALARQARGDLPMPVEPSA